jgi:antitoxin ParD1/3/4
MTVRKIKLTVHLAEFIDANVASGQFQNASDVVREALRLLERRQHEEALKLEALRRAIAVGREDAARGGTMVVAADQLGEYLSGLGQPAVA